MPDLLGQMLVPTMRLSSAAIGPDIEWLVGTPRRDFVLLCVGFRITCSSILIRIAGCALPRAGPWIVEIR